LSIIDILTRRSHCAVWYEVKAQAHSSLSIDHSVGELEAEVINTMIAMLHFGATLFVTPYGILGDKCLF
jgi:hypothetical protein